MKNLFIAFLFIVLSAQISYAEPSIAPLSRTEQQSYESLNGAGASSEMVKPVSMRNTSNNTDNSDLEPYMRKLQRTIKYNWNPPKNIVSKRVVTTFTIARNGNLLNYSIKESSGDKYTDNVALSAIRNSAPFDPLPANSNISTLEIKFTFDYSVFGANKI